MYGLPGSGKTLSNMWMLDIRHKLGYDVWTNQKSVEGFDVHIIKSDKDLNHALEDERPGAIYLDELQDGIMDSRNPQGNVNSTRFLALARKHRKFGVGAAQFKHTVDKRFKDQALWEILPTAFTIYKKRLVPTIGTWDLKPSIISFKVYRRDIDGILQPYATGTTNEVLRAKIPEHVFNLWDHHAGVYTWNEDTINMNNQKHDDLKKAATNWLNKNTAGYLWYKIDDVDINAPLHVDIVGISSTRRVFIDVLGVTPGSIG